MLAQTTFDLQRELKSRNDFEFLSVGLSVDGEIEITKDFSLTMEHVCNTGANIAARLQKLPEVVPNWLLEVSRPKELQEQAAKYEPKREKHLQDEFNDF